MKLIVGLGNPDKIYNQTRHNVGFIILDNYISKYNLLPEKKFSGLLYKYNNILFLKPMTYMNNSGLSVQKVMDYYKIESHNLLVIHDDLDMEFNKLRFKLNSSSGGHNGIKSIINNIGTQDFYRLKYGINNNNVDNVSNFVLSKFSKEELLTLNNNLDKINEIIDNFINLEE